MNNKIKAFGLISAILSLVASMPMAMADPVTVTTGVDISISAVFQYSAVDFPSLGEGTYNNTADPDSTTGAYNVTVDTNYLYKVSAQVTNDLSDGNGHTIQPENVKMGVNAVAGSLDVEDALSLTSNTQEVEGNIASTVTDSFNGFWLSIPPDQYAGAYSGIVAVTYENE